MSATAAFSVVIPASNAEAGIAAAVASALAQGERCAEVLVVDDRSTDGTAGLARAAGDPRVRVLASPRGGAGAARNAGIAAARSAWVAFLDSDDEWRPGHLDSLGAAIARRPTVVACFGAARHETREGRLIAVAGVDERHATLRGLLERRLQPTTSATAVRRDAVLAAGGFAEDFRSPAGVEDVDLWWRLARAGACTAAPAALVRYVVHEERDRRRSRAQLRDLAADRRRCIARLRAVLDGRMVARAAAQHHAIMARYWYLADFAAEGRREALASLRWAVTRNGVAALLFGIVPRPAREGLRALRRDAAKRGRG